MIFNKRNDLTRWNRSKLQMFRYIDGNAPVYLETLRQELLKQFEKDGLVKWSELVTRFPELSDETAYQTNKRLQKQYYGDKNDYAWEILRTYSRSVHVLTEYIDAYANEAYIGTATEWDNLNKLVSMLGYRPSPPSSASTYLGLIYKEGSSGVVEKGFSVKNQPNPGSPTITFETLDDYEGNSKNNLIHLKDWDKNLESIIDDSSVTSFKFYVEEVPQSVSVGDLGVFASSEDAVAVKLTSIGKDDDGVFLLLNMLSDNPGHDFLYYDSKLYLTPEFIEAPLPFGLHSVDFGKTIAISESDIIFTKKSSLWKAYSVAKSEHGLAQFESSADLPEDSETIYRSVRLNKQVLEGSGTDDEVFVLPQGLSASRRYFIQDNLEVVTAEVTPVTIGEVDFEYIDINYDGQLLYPDSEVLGVVQDVALTDIKFSGKPNNINSNDWMLFLESGNYFVSQISAISTDKNWYVVTVDEDLDGFDLAYTRFKHKLNHSNYNINQSTAWHEDSSDSVTIIEVENNELFNSLTIEQKLICHDNDSTFVVSLVNKTINDDVLRLYLSPAFHDNAGDTTRHDLAVLGNAVKASHGKTQSEKILGSGDASKINQTFVIPSDQVSWIADSLFSSGVRSDLFISVGNRNWQQVENLASSSNEDHHYEVVINQDNQLNVCFGDGVHGRRLPTGIDNVRVVYRNGYGEEGNIATAALSKIEKKHHLIEDFVAPYTVSGGAEKESTDSLRESAPATVLAISRAVSLSDYTHLVSHHSMVWHAKAFERIPNRPGPSKIEIIVVAAGGDVFNSGDEIALQLENFITAHSVPETSVNITSYQPLYLHLNISIMVDSDAFNTIKVEQSVAQYLNSMLDIKKQNIGQGLFKTDILNLIEQVEGIENSYCEILDTPYTGMPESEKPRLCRGDDGEIRKISINQNQLLYLDEEKYSLTIITQEYSI